MKREFPGGNQNSQYRPHDPRRPIPHGGFPGRGGREGPGRFPIGRGGPPPFPPNNFQGRGRGPPPMMQDLPPMGRGMNHPMGGRGGRNIGRGGRMGPPAGRFPGRFMPAAMPSNNMPQQHMQRSPPHQMQMRVPPPLRHHPPPPPVFNGPPNQAGNPTLGFGPQTRTHVPPPPVIRGMPHANSQPHFQPNNVPQPPIQNLVQHPQAAAAYPTSSVAAGAMAATGAIGNHNMQSVKTQQTSQAASATYSNDQIEMAWKEYDGPNGLKYYHNSISKESTYTKPEALIRKDSSDPNPSTATPDAAQWKEYEDTSTGRKYYSNGVTTSWEKPAGFQSEEKAVSAMDEPEQPAKKKKKKETPRKESEFANKAEAVAAFKGLLLAKGIAPTAKWNEAVKLCSSDSRWLSCEDALSVGERRQALAEYQTKRANELRDQERQERVRAKEAFGQLLTEVLPSVAGYSAWSSRFPDVRASLSKDDRFYAVEDEGTRESLFLDFCEEFRKRDERKKRNRKRDAQDAFLTFLAEREESGSLSFASTWNSFMLSLGEEDKKDPRLETSSAMSGSDRQLYFADFVIELQEKEDEKRRRIRDARRRAESAQRHNYRDLLRKLANESQITLSWRSARDIVSTHEEYALVEAQHRDLPRELFEEVFGRQLREQSYTSMISHEQPKSSGQFNSRTIDNRRSNNDENSSEDEGEIIEDGEVSESEVSKPFPAERSDKGVGGSEGGDKSTITNKHHSATSNQSTSVMGQKETSGESQNIAEAPSHE